MTQLSTNFWLNEFTRSAKAEEHNIEIVPAELDVDNLRGLCLASLQPFRSGGLGLPGVGQLRVTSGLRNTELNKLIRGSRTSQHLLASLRKDAPSAAADVSPANTDHAVGWVRLLALLGAGAMIVDQAIWYPEERRYHISYVREGKNRSELLVAYKDKSGKQKHRYIPWVDWARARQLDATTGLPLSR